MDQLIQLQLIREPTELVAKIESHLRNISDASVRQQAAAEVPTSACEGIDLTGFNYDSSATH